MIKSGTRIITLSGENTTLYGMDLYGEQLLHHLIHDLTKEEDLWKLDIGELTIKNMYKELEDENEFLKLKERNRVLGRYGEIEVHDLINKTLADDYIPVSLVEEKIEELDKEYKDILSDYGNIDTDVVINIPNENVRKYCDKLVEKIIVLQKLLEKRK